MQREKVYIYGKHALSEALANTPHIIKKVFAAEHALDVACARLQERRDRDGNWYSEEERMTSAMSEPLIVHRRTERDSCYNAAYTAVAWFESEFDAALDLINYGRSMV